MQQVGKIAIMLAVAFVVIYVPVKYFQGGAATKNELDKVAKERDSLKKTVDSTNRNAENYLSQLNERQKALSAAENKIQQLNAQVQDLTYQVKQLETVNKETQVTPPIPERMVQAPPEESTQYVLCPWCDGDYKNKYVTCKAANGGCDGKGYRRCFTCLGRGTTPCTNCGGTGQVAKQVTRSRTGAYQEQGSISERCRVCGAAGRIDCPDCETLFVRVPHGNEQFLKPIISQGTPLEQSQVVVCGYHLAIVEHYNDWIKVTGNIACPKCSGQGKVRAKGICERCVEGKIETSKLPFSVTGLPQG